jgi:hypothetical protein
MLMLQSKKIIKPAYFIIPFMLVSPLTHSDNYPVVSGTFFMATVTSSAVNLVPGTNPGILIENTFQNDALPSPPYPNPTVNDAVRNQSVLFSPFQFFGSNVGTYTAANGVDNVAHAAPTVDLLNGTADMSSFYAYWNGTEFNQGNSSAIVVDNFDGTYSISWSSLIVGGPFNGKTGSWVMVVSCPACPASESGPSVNLSATQNSVVTHTVTTSDGPVTIATDLSSTTGYTFSWGDTSNTLDSGATITTPTFSFDPSTVAEGSYNVTVRVINNNTTPIQKSISTTIINVVSSGNLADIGDNDNDGVANSADTIAAATQIQGVAGNNSAYILESSAGSLVLGNIAACASTNSAEVTLNQIKNNAGTSCSATANASDDTFAVNTGIGGYFDVQVRSLTRGEQVQVVIPLHTALPKNAGFRKFNNNQSPTWSSFETTGVDAVASAASISTGVCPAPASASWQAGLKEGHACMRLTITDAGANDADGLSNGVIALAGAIEGYPGIGTDLEDDGCSMSSHPVSARNHLEWLLVAGFLALIGLFRKQQRS